MPFTNVPYCDHLNLYPAFSQGTYLLTDYKGQLVRRLLAEAKREGSTEPVHRCCRKRTFILIKLIELLGTNSNDERTSDNRYAPGICILCSPTYGDGRDVDFSLFRALV